MMYPPRIPRSGVPVIIIAAILCSPAAKSGESEDVTAALGNPEMISLATGYSRPLFDAPVSATIVTRRDIEESGARNLLELLQTVTSYYVESPDGGRSTVLAVRGLENRVLILVDNGYLYQGLYNGLPGLQDLSLDNIERVEITRGPGSALYGADAVAGVVNIITRTSQAVTPREVGAKGGNLDTAGGYGIGALDIDGLHIATYGSYNQSDMTDRLLTADAQTAFDKAFHTHASLAPGPINATTKTTDARIDVSEDHWRVRATWHNDFDIGSGVGIADALDPNGRGSSQVGSLEWVYQNHLSTDWDLHAYLLYSDVLQGENIFLYPPGAFGNHFPDGVHQLIDEEEDRARGEATAIYAAGDNRLLMSAGAFMDDARTTADVRNYVVIHGGVIPTGQFASGGGVDSPLLVGDREDNVVYGVLQDEWAFAKDFSLIAGTRLDYYNRYGAQWSPRAALVWSPSQSTTWKLLYNEAFRPPSVTETQSNGTFAALGNPNLFPSKTREGELQFGYRWKSVDLTASAFTYNTDSLIVTTIDKAAPLGIAYINGNNDRAYGMDGEIKWHATKSVTFTVNGMYQHHSSASEQYFIAESPPKKLVNATLDWQFLSQWNVYVNGAGVFDQGRASTDIRPPPANYGLLNFAIRTTALPSGIVASLRATNALNKYYVQSSGSPTALPYDVPQPARIVTLQLTKSFR
jgi:iron complex outermembrane receptor protein